MENLGVYYKLHTISYLHNVEHCSLYPTSSLIKDSGRSAGIWIVYRITLLIRGIPVDKVATGRFTDSLLLIREFPADQVATGHFTEPGYRLCPHYPSNPPCYSNKKHRFLEPLGPGEGGVEIPRLYTALCFVKNKHSAKTIPTIRSSLYGLLPSTSPLRLPFIESPL